MRPAHSLHLLGAEYRIASKLPPTHYRALLTP